MPVALSVEQWILGEERKRLNCLLDSLPFIIKKMEKKYIIPATIAISYLIYRKFYAIDFKELNYSQRDCISELDLLLLTPSDNKSLEERIDDIDWEEVSG